MKISRRSLLSMIGILAIPAAYSHYECLRIEVTRLRLDMGARIAFLTDTHIHFYDPVKEEIIRLLDREDPDIVLHGGDILDELTPSLDPVKRFLSQIDAIEKYAVLGNHDHWSGRIGELAKILRECGFRLLIDEWAESRVGRIYGVDWRDSRRYKPASDATILLAHDPNVTLEASGSKLILAGHTHGGIVIQGLTLLSNSAYARGLHEVNGSILYVSRGLGQMIPLRPTSPLELVIIE
ncbi:MAG: metallophosphoesterase [Thaumarchaeota archaeon]|nr:metallophosphoesterase [Nitrososphaerota archaeon]